MSERGETNISLSPEEFTEQSSAYLFAKALMLTPFRVDKRCKALSVKETFGEVNYYVR